MRTNLFYLALGSASLLAACGDDPPPAPATVRAQIATDLPHVMSASKAALDGTQQALPVLPPQLGFGMAVVQARYPMLNPLLHIANHARARPTDPTDTFDPGAEAKWLNDNVFTDANQIDAGIYKIPNALACTVTSTDDTGATTSTLDADCAAKFDQLDLRIRVEQNDATLRFAIQLDAAHDEPVAFTLRHDAVGATVNLDGAEAAMTALAPTLGETAPNAALTGQISALLEVPGDAHVKASLTIDRDVAVAYGEAGVALDGPAAFHYASAKANVFALELDGAQKFGSLAVALGATTAHAPADAAGPSMDLDLPGATATATFAAGQPLAVMNVSLGDRTTTLARGGVVAEAIDLNPADGRAVGFSVTGDANGSTTAILPKLDLRLTANHAALGDDAPLFDIVQYLVDGTAPQLAASATSDQLKVVAGHFAVVTNPAAYGVSIAAGQCAAETDVIDANTGASYAQWMTQTCD